MLELHIKQYTLKRKTGDEIVFSWQGGEPTLNEGGFLKRVTALQHKYKKPNRRVENDLQTNGILLDEHWCAFLKKT